MTFLLYTLISTALWYLGSRALITRAVWSRYPPNLAAFMDCPACVGFWWGLILALTVGVHNELVFMGLPAQSLPTPPLVGLCMIAAVPVFAGLVQWGFDHVGNVVATEDDSIDFSEDD